MKIELRIPVVVCRDGSYSGWGHGDKGGKEGDVDTGCLYDNWDQAVRDSDLQMITVTANVDVENLFAEKTVRGAIAGASDASET